ncbi:MAG: TlpA family protein disulfide reductase, partial [Actinomycetota bacterium]|nr:TlpA family protein disulfide reductase [Actinomycetota bacterium]
MDAGGPSAVRRFVEAAAPDFPVVLDEHHVLGRLFGVVNVPSGIWVDEQGVLVRPPETAYPSRPRFAQIDPEDPAVQARMPAAELERLRKVIPHVTRMRIEPEAYVAALRDWVAHGAASQYALPPDEVVARSRPRPREQAEAAAAFELATAVR